MTGSPAHRIVVAGIAAAVLWAAPLSASEPATAASPRHTVEAARRTIEAYGFHGVQNLQVTGEGGWSGFATKYDRRWVVALDERGNFTGAPAAPQDGPGASRPKPPKAGIRLFLIIR